MRTRNLTLTVIDDNFKRLDPNIKYNMFFGLFLAVVVGTIMLLVTTITNSNHKHVLAVANKHHYAKNEAAFCSEPRNDKSYDDFWADCKIITQVDNTEYSVNYKGLDGKTYINTVSVTDMKTNK